MKLIDYMPEYYDGVKEIVELLNSEQPTFDKQVDLMTRLLLNGFVMKADSQGLSIMEYELKIPTDLSKSLENRRYDILMRILPPHSITIKYFRELLKSFEISVDVEVDAVKDVLQAIGKYDDISKDQMDRLKYLLNVYVPANIDWSILTTADADSQLSLFVGVGATYSVETSTNARLNEEAESRLPFYIGVVHQFVIETENKAKEGQLIE
ncbi:MAG: YmfQ family protein [Lentilactobacillus buchneri]|jgi:hypothetical protein|nr:YmfQ family protein [Lentilactobacillus buchneri]MCI1950661.1 YmfQ family protein [Lentilactobacillus buchneri]MCI2018262.1 YmfQ family protein [Lentilactobacillus buchneri]MCI2027787.1 YmfQ family protein [Lentilactobacillus buchneri]